MLFHQKHLLTAIAGTLAIGLTSSAFAYTCPMNIKREQNGFWYSNEKPGWKSHKSTPPNVTLSAKDFGGVVYSPKRNRIVKECWYAPKDSNLDHPD